MRIVRVSETAITFDNGNRITYDHDEDCSEWNYADFDQIERIALVTEFHGELEFESIENSGFRFRAPNTQWFFIPCYSSQNGYYSTDIEIYYNNQQVLHFYAEEDFY